MPAPQKQPYLPVEEYLAKEEHATLRHEYIDGRAYAMSGTTRRHNVIAANLLSALHGHVRGSGCRVYMSDVKVRVEATNSFYYPDLMVSCEPRDDASVISSRPVLLIEVLSRSTKTIDRREKLFAYRQIPSLKEYLIVYQSKQRVEMHRKNQQGGWDCLEFGPGDQLVLESIPAGNFKIALPEIYEDVDLDQGTDLQVREGPEQEWSEDDTLDW